MNYRNLILPTLIFGAIALSAVEATAATPPVLGTSPRFCNPLPMEIGKGGSATGDVSVIKGYDGKYYMFCSGGGAWVSDDLYNWEHHPVKIDRLPVAPDVGMYNGKYYLSGNGTGLYESENPLGPYKYLGDWKNTPSVKDGWNGSFDTKFFVDDDNTPYLFYVGYAVSGVYAVKLDPNDLTRFATLPVNLVTFNSEHWWERYGEMNEYSDVAWIEGPWIVKHGDTYYLEYSASGTQWKSYAAGYYTSKSVLGPYTYAGTNPLCRNTEGIVTGPGHGSVIEGPDGNFWQFYTVVLSNPPGGRLIGMDRIVVDENGDWTCKITDTPQWAPGVVADPEDGDSGSIAVTVGKVAMIDADSSFSSEQEGRYAAYVADNSSGTWWEPAADDKEPAIVMDLSGATEYDVTNIYTVDGVRFLFGGGRGGRRTLPAQNAPRPDLSKTFYKYRIETSLDGKNFKTVLDKTGKVKSQSVVYEDFTPSECRYVKITITDWPKDRGPLKIMECTVFGKATSYLPPKSEIPWHK